MQMLNKYSSSILIKQEYNTFSQPVSCDEIAMERKTAGTVSNKSVIFLCIKFQLHSQEQFIVLFYRNVNLN